MRTNPTLSAKQLKRAGIRAGKDEQSDPTIVVGEDSAFVEFTGQVVGGRQDGLDFTRTVILLWQEADEHVDRGYWYKYREDYVPPVFRDLSDRSLMTAAEKIDGVIVEDFDD